MIFHARFSTLTALALGLTMHAASTRADTLDWNSITYAPATPAAAQTNTSLGTTAGGNSASLQFTLNNGATFLTSAPSPVTGANTTNALYASGGNTASLKFLQAGMDFANATQSTTVDIFFAKPIANLTFSFFDIDFSNTANANFVDQVRNIIGVTSTGADVNPMTVSGSADNTVTTVAGVSTITGNTSSGQTAATANATITFDGTQITQLEFVYGDAYVGTGGHSATQIIGVSDLTFNTVPEPGTLAVLGLGTAGLGTVAMLRRRK